MCFCRCKGCPTLVGRSLPPSATHMLLVLVVCGAMRWICSGLRDYAMIVCRVMGVADMHGMRLYHSYSATISPWLSAVVYYNRVTITIVLCVHRLCAMYYSVILWQNR